MSVETSCSRIDMAQDRKENVASQEFDDRAMLLGTDLTFGVDTARWDVQRRTVVGSQA